MLEQEPVSKLCDELGLQPTVFYRWQKELTEPPGGWLIFTELWLRVVVARRGNVYIPSSRRAGFRWRKAKVVLSILLGHASIKITERHYAPWVKAPGEA